MYPMSANTDKADRAGRVELRKWSIIAATLALDDKWFKVLRERVQLPNAPSSYQTIRRTWSDNRIHLSLPRALQAAPQRTWSGKAENVAAAQGAFSHRAMMNGLAALGQWSTDLERKAA